MNKDRNSFSRLAVVLVMGAIAIAFASADEPAPSTQPAAKDLKFEALPAGVPADHSKLATWDIHKNFLFQWKEVVTPKEQQAVIELMIPAGHKIFTVVINDEKGVRVRNLVAMGNVKNYGGNSESGKPQTLRVAWNGLDDKGNPVSAGTYRVEGLSLPALKAEFDYAWYNPGNPTWQGYATSGWGGDHSGPTGVACVPAGSKSKWRVILSWPTVESPHATIALDSDYKKVWGFKRVAGFDGSKSVAIADGCVWLGVKNELLVLQLDSGKNRGWDAPAGHAPSMDVKGVIDCVAVGEKYAATLLGTSKEIKNNRIVFVDKKHGQDPTSKEFPGLVTMEEATNSIAFSPQGILYASTKAGVVSVDVKGTIAAVELKGLEKPGALTFDPDGNLYAMDLGDDYQVKVYSPKLELLRTIGTKGGQPISHPGYFWTIPAKTNNGLEYDASAMHSVQSLAIDEFGQLWVAEGHPHPRRVAVFGKDGKMTRQFVGCTDYGAGNTVLHNQDPTLGASCGILFSVDPTKTNSYQPVRYLTSGPNFTPPPKDGPNQRLNTQVQAAPFTQGQLFRSDASGKMHEYYMSALCGFPVLFLQRNGDYQPVAAIGNAASTRGVLNKPEFAKKPKTIFIWSDLNDDGLVQPEEVQALPEGGNGRVMDFYGWNYLIQPDLVFYADQLSIPPVKFTDAGTPIYDMGKATKLKESDLFLRVGKHLVGTAGANAFQVGVYKFADMEGNSIATYPLVAWGVHSSEHSLIPRAGETVGDLFFIGTADMGEKIGSVVASEGDMGQAFLFTEDGMYISSLFRDGRSGSKPYPSKAEKGADLTDCTMWGEPFGVWFGRQSDGKVRVMYGRNEAIVCQVKGLDEIQRCESSRIRVITNVPGTKEAPIVPDQAVTLKVPRVPDTGDGSIQVDGSLGDWRNVPSYKITAGDTEAGDVQLAHDGTNLFVAFRVFDASPMLNKAQDERAYFKEGDCVDLKLGPRRKEPGEVPVQGDLRLLLVPTKPAPSAVLYRAVVPGTKDDQRVKLTSPIMTTVFDSVKKSPDVQVVFTAVSGGYICEMRVPFKTLGVTYAPGLNLIGDLGILFSDEGGQATTSRVYLFNKRRTMTADVGEEAKLLPSEWGTIVLE